MVPPGGDAREVYCFHGDGEAARAVCLLPTPECRRGGGRGREDQFALQRPILAVVKRGRPSTGSVPYSSVQLLSLRGAGPESLVKKIQFKGQPVVGLHGNRRVLVAVLRKRVVVMDSCTFSMRFYIKNNYPQLDYPLNPVALGQRWLAYTETKLSSKHRSGGGVSSSQPPSVATAVIKNVKKGISAITDTFSGLTGKSQQSSESTDMPQQSPDHSTANVITVLDTAFDHPEEVRLHEAGREEGGVVAHFPAHTERGVNVAALSFNHSGTLLITATTEGHTFNVFHLVPHPLLSSETDVHHLYQLFRGATSATVQDLSFSKDSRWVTVSTLNGTTHVFPIAPYGGEITVRTHVSSWVANKLSRFHTSAGIDTIPSRSHSHIASSPASASLHSLPPSHPIPLSSLSSLSSAPLERQFAKAPPKPITWNNPRGVPLSTPLIVTALHQIKQPYLSATDGGGLAVGVTSTSGPTPNLHGDPGDPWLDRPDVQCVRATFSTATQHRERGSSDPSPPHSTVYSLYVLGGSGVLTEHRLKPRPHEEAREGDDAPISLDCRPLICWRLLSKPHPPTMKLPLPEDNPLIKANNEYRAFLETRKSKRGEEGREEGDRGRGGGGGGGGSSQSEGAWLSQVEILTHATPTRRLWMGPQFSFKIYSIPLATGATGLTGLTGLATGSGAGQPATGDLISLSPDHTHPIKQRSLSTSSEEREDGREGGEEGGGSAVLSLSHGTLLSDLFSQPAVLSLQPVHTSPISMATASSPSSREHGMESGTHGTERGVLEVCGSWKKVAPQLEPSQLADVERELAEAIEDHCTYHPHSSQPQVTVATQRSGQLPKTGFQTPNNAP